MFCRWNTIYSGKIFPIVFRMKYLRFRRLTFAVTSRSCLILEIFGSTDLHCSLLKESCSDVDILPVVTQVEVDKFILTIYGQSIVTGDKYSSDTEPFDGFSDAEILAAGGTIQLHPRILQDMLHYNCLQATVILGIWDQRRDKYYVWILYQVRVSLSSLHQIISRKTSPRKIHFDKRRTASLSIIFFGHLIQYLSMSG